MSVNTGSKIESIIKNETLLIKGLKFQFFVYSPYRSFDGYFEIIQENLEKLEIYELKENIKKVHLEGHKTIRHLHYTDSGFLYSPSMVGLAALFFSIKQVCGIN